MRSGLSHGAVGNRVAEQQEAGWWSRGGENGGAAGQGMVDIEGWSTERQPVVSAAALRELFLQLLMWDATMAWEAGETHWE